MLTRDTAVSRLRTGPSGRPVAPGRGAPPETVALDPQLLVTFAVLAICHSRTEVSCGLSISAADRAPETVAATDDVPVRADWLQHELGEGPDVHPASGEVSVSRDLGREERWPDFGRMCVAVLGLRSMVSIAVPVPDARATLNFFAAEPSAFDRFDVDAALRLARLAAPAAASALEVARRAQREGPRSDFSKAAVALGIVMARYRVGSAAGFALLREAAQDLDLSLLELAVRVVQDGRLPEAAIAGVRHARNNRGSAWADGAPGLAVGGPELWREPPEAPQEASVPPAGRRRRGRTPRLPLAVRRWIVQDTTGVSA